MKKYESVEITLYKTEWSECDFYGQYPRISLNYFSYNPQRSDKWQIVPSGSSEWDSLDQNAWHGKDIAAYYDKWEDIPVFLPDFPSPAEVKAVATEDRVARLKGKDSYPATDYPDLKNYFEQNNLTENRLFFVMGENRYESIFGDGIYKYLKGMSFSKEQLESEFEIFDPLNEKKENELKMRYTLKFHTITYKNNSFYMDDFNPGIFDHYDFHSLISKINAKVGEKV